MNTYDKIYQTVKQIPEGKVATYGQIAMLALGSLRYSRVVGYALHVNPSQQEIPCHRVVNRNGNLSPAFAFGGKFEHKRLLENEGLLFDDDTVNLEKYLWRN